MIQTIGRSARNVNAKVILYADRVTDSMQRAIDETRRRREIQEAYNQEHGIVPETIRKAIRDSIEAEMAAHQMANQAAGRRGDEDETARAEYLEELEKEMLDAAEALDFERAAAIRDRILELKEQDGSAPAAGKSQTTDGRSTGRKLRRSGRASHAPRATGSVGPYSARGQRTK